MPHSLGLRGKLRLCDPVCTLYVFQRVAPGLGNVPEDPTRSLQKRRHVVPADPKTPAQLARRSRFAAGVAAWHALDSNSKRYWRALGARLGISGINAFMRAFLRA